MIVALSNWHSRMRTKGWSVYVTVEAGTGGVSGASRCRPARLLPEAEMLVGDLARPEEQPW